MSTPPPPAPHPPPTRNGPPMRPDTCQHKPDEECLNCDGCGLCREDVDDDGYCPDCADT